MFLLCYMMLSVLESSTTFSASHDLVTVTVTWCDHHMWCHILFCLFFLNKIELKKIILSLLFSALTNCKYDSSSWFILSFWPSVCGWNNVDNFVSISNILFSFFINFTTNYGFLFKIILSGNLCNFHILSLNNCANPSANISFVFATKFVVLDNLS